MAICVPAGRFANHSPIRAVDLWMNDRLEIGSRRAVGEHEPAQCRAIEAAVREEELRSKTLNHSRQARGSRRDRLTSQGVGVNDACT